jgi:hypothetical protein
MPITRTALAVVALLALAAGCGGTSSAAEKTADAGKPPISLQERSVPHAGFGTPDDWTGGDDGANHIVGSAPVEDYAIYQNKDFSAGIEYESFAPPAQVPGRDVIKNAIDQGLRAQKAASDEQVLGMRETAGHGCVAGGPFAYVEQPSTKETARSYSLRYGYTCTSQHGPIQGYSITAYDWQARKHSVTVTALTSYWKAHEEQLKAVIDSWDAR